MPNGMLFGPENPVPKLCARGDEDCPGTIEKGVAWFELSREFEKSELSLDMNEEEEGAVGDDDT